MKKISIFALLILAVVLIVYFKKPGTSSLKSKAFSGTLKAAVQLGVPMKCKYQVNGMEYEGHVKGKKWRGKMKYPDGRQGEVIMKDNCMWSWSDNDKQGITMCFEPTEDDQDMWDQPEGATAPDIDYNCSPTVITDAMFTPPSDINFSDLEGLMNPNMPQNIPEVEGMPSTINGVPTTPEDFDMFKYKDL